MRFANGFLIFVFILFGIILAGGVGATAPSWGSSSTINYTAIEGVSYYHNLSSNITGFNNDVTFAIDTTPPNYYIYWTTSNGRSSVSVATISSWINITNSSSGNLTINARYDNQTGFFEIPIQAKNITDDSATTEVFEFIINATNDAPNFTSAVNSSYSVPISSGNYSLNLYATDEEMHYPLAFNYTVYNCSVSSLSTRYNSTGDDNCTLTISNATLSQTSYQINLTGLTSNDMGVYNLSVCVMDNATANVSRIPLYADASYNDTKFTCKNIKLNIQSALTITSNCSGLNLTEDGILGCRINVSTKGESDNLILWSNASLRGYTALSGAFNQSWFYFYNASSAENFFYYVDINVSLDKLKVGNWSINFTVNDTTSSEVGSALFYIYVNWSGTNSLPAMTSISNINNLSVNYFKEIYFNVSDNDIIVPDKNVRNETFNYSYTVLNQTDLSVLANFSSDFNFSRIGDVAGTNKTRMKILFTPNSSEAGNYTINVTATDSFGEVTFSLFNVSILSNSAPQWNSSVNYVFNLNTSTVAGDESFRFTLNLTNASGLAYAFDNELDEISFTNGSAFTHFNLSNGVINFIPWKQDIGSWNISITATDTLGLTNTTYFIFNISNNNTSPKIISLTSNDDESPITNGSSVTWAEDAILTFELSINDTDLLIINKSVYNESLNVDMVVAYLNGTAVSDFFNFNFNSNSSENQTFLGSFTPAASQIGNYSVVLSVTDNSSAVAYLNFNVNITSTADAPNLSLISNQFKTTNEALYLDINATDEEDGSDSSGNLVFAIYNLTAGGNFINSSNFNSTTGVINLTSLEGYAGLWTFNVTVNDTNNDTDSQEFNITIYGPYSLTSPSEEDVFNFTENIADNFSFALNHSVGDNLTYELWMNNITCSYQNNSNCTYSNMSLVQSANNSGNGSLFNWSFTPSYWDETYGNYKNLTLRVYPATLELNSTQKTLISQNFTFYLNISHTNYPVVVVQNIPNPYSSTTYGSTTPITIDLTSYFRDIDYLDGYYLQDVIFNITTNVSNSIVRAESYETANRLPWNGTISDWSLQLYGEEAGSEQITIVANDSNSSSTNGPFTVTFTAPSTTPVATPTSSGGGGSSIKHYSLRIITPADIIVSENNFISVPFSVENNGEIDLAGINLSTMVFYENLFSDAVSISLEDAYIDKLGFGQSKNFTMTIRANTHVAGKYKATVYADITSPKFSDWGDFYIELRKTNESEAEQMLLFTEKLISENPKCIELTELLNEARKLLDNADYSASFQKSKEALNACENAISSNEQVNYRTGETQDLFTYIGYSTLVVFGIGFIFYIYKRVRFNKSKIND